MRRRSRPADGLFFVASAVAALVAFSPILSMVGWLVARGSGRLAAVASGQEPLGFAGGLMDCALGSLTVVTLATAVAAPLGVAAGLIALRARASVLARVTARATDVLAAVPPICVGIACYGLVVMRQGTFSLAAGAVALTAIELPLVIRATRRALERIPEATLGAAVALGGSPWRTVRHVVLPATWRPIAAGVLMAMARAIGEAAPLLLTALDARWLPRDLASPAPTLAVRVYARATGADGGALDEATGAGLALVILVVALMAGARSLEGKARPTEGWAP